MKLHETRQQFIELRAAGYSYASIARKLQIAKSTCTLWQKEFAEEIAQLKAVELDTLYECYGMKKAAKIKLLGETLKKVTAALEKADFLEVAPEKLLDLQLKYFDALQREYVNTDPARTPKGASLDELTETFIDLLGRIRAGEVTTETAAKEITILGTILKAYDMEELKDKIDALEIAAGR